MANFFKNKVVTGLIVSATVMLAGVSVFAAYRLYKLGQNEKTPTSSVAETIETQSDHEPEVTTSAEELAFEIQAQGISPNPTETPTQAPTQIPTSPPTPTVTPIATTTPTLAATTTPTPIPTEAIKTTSLPDAGVGMPTIFSLGFGSLLIILAIFLAI